MKIIFIILVLLFAVECRAQSILKLEYEYLRISFYPKKCIDTFDFQIPSGEFKNCWVKIFLEDCSGQCKILVVDKKNKTKLTGFYSNGFDTLTKYSFTKIMGKPKGHSYSKARLLNYLNPLPTGIWTFFDKSGNVAQKTEYHFEREIL